MYLEGACTSAAFSDSLKLAVMKTLRSLVLPAVPIGASSCSERMEQQDVERLLTDVYAHRMGNLPYKRMYDE